jgi:hypothetical protein
MTCSQIRRALVILCEESLGIREGCGDEIFGDTLAVGSRNDHHTNPGIHQGQVSCEDKEIKGLS